MIDELINKIKEIDKALDAYEYAGYTYKEYIYNKNNKLRGDKSLRNMYYKGSHIWSDDMENTLNRIKQITNKLFLMYKHKYELKNEDINEIKILINRIDDIKRISKNRTDQLSIYPIQSELIYDNFDYIKNCLDVIINKE